MMKPFLVLALLFPSLLFSQLQFDILIRNGRVIDGSGNPWYFGDVGIKEGKIAAIGDLSNRIAKKNIDAQQQIIAPGFIDVHGHIEQSILARPQAKNFLFDGVTTIITGNCGGSRIDMAVFFETLESTGICLNVASLIGHNSVRRAVMGAADRVPNPKELREMKALVEKAMQEGAVGLSTGLIYVPGTYAETEEVVALAKVAAQYKGVYASHIRNENNEIVDAINEAVNIGKEAKLPVQISHFKLGSKSMWRKSDMTVGLIEKYRSAGIDVTVDQYPYTASSTTLTVTLPNWSLAGGIDSLNKRLKKPAVKQRILKDMESILREKGFSNYNYAAIANCGWEPSYNGKRIPAVNRMRGNPDGLTYEMETILELVGKGPRIQMVFHSMSEEDVQYIMKSPYAMVASDAGIPRFDVGMPHPRAYGTNARVLGRYVRALKNITLEEAIRKMTSLPAQRFKLKDRGLIRVGMAADIVIFDPEVVSDVASFEQPHAYSKGFSHVLVNGIPIIDAGKYKDLRSGKVLRLGKE